MELYEYTGIDDIKSISRLETSVWDYLKVRTKESLSNYLIRKMKSHCKEHDLTKKISTNWKHSEDELTQNVDGLAKYVTEGIVEVVN